jgi:hypothetical protein
MTHDIGPGSWPMKHDALVAATSAELPGEEVLAAGIFSLEVPVRATMADGLVGGIGGSVLGGALGGSGAGNVLGSVAGMQVAEHRNAEQQGLSRQLAVAITPTKIHVISRHAGGTEATRVVSFDRDTCQVEVKNFGIGKFVHLTDPTDGHHVNLGASTLSKYDRKVMKLLTGDMTASKADSEPSATADR